MHRLAKHYGLPQRDFTPDVLEAWQAHDWPGNLRELEQSLKRYLVMGGIELCCEKKASYGKDKAGDALSPESYSPNGLAASPRQPCSSIFGYKSLRALLQGVKEEAEKNALALALERTGWNRKAAARLLKTSYRSVLYKIEQYQMTSSTSSFSAADELRNRDAQAFGNGHGNVTISDFPKMADGG
jgi:two-component system response regulator AtoC